MRVKLHYIQPKHGFMPGCKWLGTVTDDDDISGALMLHPDGHYVMVRNGKAWPINQDAVAAAVAESLTPAKLGRPPDGERKVQYVVTLPPSMADFARKLGNGNLSAGIRFTINAYMGAEE